MSGTASCSDKGSGPVPTGRRGVRTRRPHFSCFDYAQSVANKGNGFDHNDDEYILRAQTWLLSRDWMERGKGPWRLAKAFPRPRAELG